MNKQKTRKLFYAYIVPKFTLEKKVYSTILRSYIKTIKTRKKTLYIIIDFQTKSPA